MLQKAILQKRLLPSNDPMEKPQPVKADDPSRLQPTLASEPAPSLQDLLDKHRPRFQDK